MLSFNRPYGAISDIEDFYNFMTHLNETGILREVAQTWLNFNRQDKNKKIVKGAALIETAIDELLTPLSAPLPIQNFEISLELKTGNIIYEKFEDLEDLLNFIQEYTQNPAKILERITPKKRQE